MDMVYGNFILLDLFVVQIFICCINRTIELVVSNLDWSRGVFCDLYKYMSI